MWDNNDFGEETLTGAGTTHNTNGIILQWESQETRLEPEISFEVCKKSRKRTLDSTSTYVVPYKLVKRSGPINLTPIHNTEKDQLLMCQEFYRKADAGFYLTKLVNKSEVPGWTGFNTLISGPVSVPNTKIGYLPIIDANPTELATINTVLIQSLKIADELQLFL